MNRAVYLDRDGVINEVIFREGDKPVAPWSIEEFILIPCLGKPLEKLTRMGYLLFVITNQPDIAKGHVDGAVVEMMNKVIMETYPIKEIKICPHIDSHNCDCRKPKPGMLLDLSKKWDINLEQSFMIGDNWKDIDAGNSAGCKTILIDKNYNEGVQANYRVANLDIAVELIESFK